jgi:hypothetical protein
VFETLVLLLWCAVDVQVRRGSMDAPISTQKPRRIYTQTGYYAAKKALMRFGEAAIDGRTGIGKALRQWRCELVSDLGGLENLTSQQLVIVDLAARTKLLVDSLDSVLLVMKSPVNKRNLSVWPIVTQRGQEADRLARYMTLLGLERRKKPVLALNDYLDTKYRAHGDSREAVLENDSMNDQQESGVAGDE